MISRIARGSPLRRYISFNHAADFNQATLEGRNQVQLHTKEGWPEGYAPSFVQARLAAGEQYTAAIDGNSVDIVVREINIVEGWAEVTVGLGLEPTSAPTTGTPTSPPTLAPCDHTRLKIEIEIETDNYPGETFSINQALL